MIMLQSLFSLTIERWIKLKFYNLIWTLIEIKREWRILYKFIFDLRSKVKSNELVFNILTQKSDYFITTCIEQLIITY